MSNIERGEIREKIENGYVVASLDREGIETQPIKALEDKEYTSVFFLFPGRNWKDYKQHLRIKAKGR